VNKATLKALAAIGLWGTLAALSLRLKAIPPFLLVGVALLLGALCGVRGIRLRGLRPRVLALGVYGLFAYHLCLFLALRRAPPVEANLLNYLWPLLIVLLTPLFVPNSPLRASHVAGAAIGFTGAVLLVTGGRIALTSEALLGYLLAIAAAVIWSTYSLLTHRMSDFPTSTVATFCAVSGALSLGCHFLFEPSYAFAAADLPWLALIGLGPMGLAFYLWDSALKAGDPRTLGMLAYLAPLLSTTLVVLIGGGRLSALSGAAMALIVGGAVVGTGPDLLRRDATRP
jgi:drug/metabolite transporter (DMT)-like permease